MATGNSSNQGKIKKTPIEVIYSGKKTEKEILSLKPKDYKTIAKINGKRNNNNFFYFGDNLDGLLTLLNSDLKGRIELIYIDPPFATELNFVSKEQQHAYSDILAGAEFVEYLRERLVIMRELLSKTGSIYVHLDSNMAFTMKLIMDEIFGEKNCRAFITRKKCSTKNYTRNTYGNISDYVMFYSKSNKYTWNRPYQPWEIDKMFEQYPCIDEKTGRRYKKVPIHAPGIRNGETGKEWKGMMPPKGKHWQYTPDKLDEMDKAGEIYWSPTGNPRRKVFCEPDKGIPIQDIWLDYRDSINQATKTTGYPTEKNYNMLKMIVGASSNEDDFVLDCFSGSGTTLGASYELKRKWIGMDNSIESLKAILKRFTTGVEAYGDYVNKGGLSQQLKLDIEEKCGFDILLNEKNNDLYEEIMSLLPQDI